MLRGPTSILARPRMPVFSGRSLPSTVARTIRIRLRFSSTTRWPTISTSAWKVSVGNESILRRTLWPSRISATSASGTRISTAISPMSATRQNSSPHREHHSPASGSLPQFGPDLFAPSDSGEPDSPGTNRIG